MTRESHTYKVLESTELFDLIQRRKEKKIWFEVVYKRSIFDVNWIKINHFMGDQRNTSKSPNRWKFNSKSTASKKYFWAILHWSK